MQRPIAIVSVVLLSCTNAMAQDLPPSQPADHGALMQAGDRAYEAGDLHAAIRNFTRADSAASSFSTRVRLARAWNDQATELFASGQPREAKLAAETASSISEELIALAPLEAEAWFYLAAAKGTQALFARGREKVRLGAGVEEHCLRALAIDSTFALPHIALGIYYREIAELSRLERFVARSLFGSIPRNSAGKALLHSRRAVELAPELRVAHYQLARTLEAFGKEGAARVVYSNALQHPPQNARDRRNEATIRRVLVEPAIE